jgi:hypothetical protein
MSKLSRLDMKQNKKHKKPIHERDRKRKRKKISSFFRNGSIASASASIDAHNHLFCKILSSKLLYHGSQSVETKSNIIYHVYTMQSMSNSPSTMVEEIMYNHHQTVASSNHMLPRLQRK